MLTEHSSENITSAKSSPSDKTFKQCSIRLGLFTSLTNWQYFVPHHVQPSFFRTRLTVRGDTSISQRASKMRASLMDESSSFLRISSSITSKCRMTSFLVRLVCGLSYRVPLYLKRVKKRLTADLDAFMLSSSLILLAISLTFFPSWCKFTMRCLT